MSDFPIVYYKGHRYYELFNGMTRWGRRAQLQFFDGTKTFWVDAEKVTRSDPGTGPEGPTMGGKQRSRALHYLNLLDPSSNASEGEIKIALQRLRKLFAESS